MKIQFFRLITGIAAIYHTLLGLAGLLLPIKAFTELSGYVLGVSPDLNAQFELIVKFSSAYVLAFGIMLLLLAWNPVKNRTLIVPALVLFGVRLVNKIVFFGLIGTSFKLDPARNIFGILIISFFFCAILFTMPKEKR